MELIKESRVTAHVIDATKKLSVMGVFQFAEEGVTELLGAMELDGFSVARKYDAFWVFIKNRVILVKELDWNEECILKAFISKKSIASICIDVAVMDKSNDICAYSRVELVALDKETGKIRKTPTVGMDDTIEVYEPMMDMKFTKFSKKELPEIDRVTVKYTNIDYLHHTNNKEYIRFILDTYTVQGMLDNPIKEMEVLYAGQSHEGDELTINGEVLDGVEYYSICREDEVMIKAEVVRRL